MPDVRQCIAILALFMAAAGSQVLAQNNDEDSAIAEEAAKFSLTVVVVGPGDDGPETRIRGVDVTLIMGCDGQDVESSRKTNSKGRTTFVDLECDAVELQATGSGYKTGGASVDLPAPDDRIRITLEKRSGPQVGTGADDLVEEDD